MKCPKCDYLGFETGDRCKNCGYDFSLLAAPQTEPDLALKTPARDDMPIGDLWLDNAAATGTESAAATASPVESFPLFSPGGEDDEPLIKTPSEPRAPLSVRRAPELSRSRSASRTPRSIDTGLTLEFAEEAPVEAPVPIRPAAVVQRASVPAASSDSDSVAS